MAGFFDNFLGASIDPAQAEMLKLLGADPEAVQKKARQDSLRNLGAQLIAANGQRGSGLSNVANGVANWRGGGSAVDGQMEKLMQAYQLKQMMAANQQKQSGLDAMKNIDFSQVPEELRPTLQAAAAAGDMKTVGQIMSKLAGARPPQPTEFSLRERAAQGDTVAQAALDRMLTDRTTARAAGKSSINLSTSFSPGDKQFQKDAVEKINNWEIGARAGQQTLAAIGDIKNMMTQINGGRYEQAQAWLQEYDPTGLLGKDKAQIKQQFIAATRPMMESELQKMRGLGSMTEVEFKAATAALPQFGQQKEATEYLTRLFERQAKASIDTYEKARQFMDTDDYKQNGFMRFQPSYTTPQAPQLGNAPAAPGAAGAPKRLRYNPTTGKLE